MDNLPAKFNYGRCPSCDRIIPVPSGVNKIHCCYCGESFLARAAITYYGYQKPIQIITSVPVPAKSPPIEPEPKPQRQAQPDLTVPKMMSIKEVAKATGISESSIRLMVREGKLPSIRMGTKYLLNCSKVCDLINQGLVGYWGNRIHAHHSSLHASALFIEEYAIH